MFPYRSIANVLLLVSYAALRSVSAGAAPLTVSSALVQNSDPAVVYAELDDAATRKLMKGCSPPRKVYGGGAPGSQILLQLTVSDAGKLESIHRVQGGFTHEMSMGFASCRFAVYKVNGEPTAFHGNVVIDVK